MPGAGELMTRFDFGTTTVEILQGDITAPGVAVDAVVSTDDNYLTMGSGVASALRRIAGPCYAGLAQEQCPVKAGTVVVTKPYKLRRHLPTVRRVLHGTVIDYDTADVPLAQLVYQTTENCLHKAEELGLCRIVFPVFGAGSGGLEMAVSARQMCSAMKAYLAEERPLDSIYILLHWPDDPEARRERAGRNEQFIQEANLVLGVPYSPAQSVRQTRDFYGRGAEMQKLAEVITGQLDGKKHGVILGGPRIGKSALLDQIFHQAQESGSPLSNGRRVGRVIFGRVHQKTPASFVYRRFLCSLGETEADPDIDTDQFLEFLEVYSDDYPEVLFLIDDLPRLLRMGAEDFWDNLERLQGRVRFVFTARDDDNYQQLQEQLGPDFLQETEVIRLKCFGEEQPEQWIRQMYRRYLGRPPTKAELEFFEREAGQHPYLIQLLGHGLIEAIKRDALKNSEHHPTRYTKRALQPFFRQAVEATEGPRRQFFDLLIGAWDPQDLPALQNLARTAAIDREWRLLSDEADDPKAPARLAELQREKLSLLPSRETLERLEDRGYVVKAASSEEAQFMASSFATYLIQFFGIGAPQEGQPRDVTITLLRPKPQEVMALFTGGGATIDLALRELLDDDVDEFMQHYGLCVRHLKDPSAYPDPGPYRNLKEVGNHILTQFATGAIKAYLQDLPKDSTISLSVDHALKRIPWELMMEPAYTTEIPFRVGRRVVGREPRRFASPVRGDDKVKVLLIGDPTGDLHFAAREAEDLKVQLEKDGRFDPVMRLGPEECARAKILRDLESGQYRWIHYSGHAKFEGYRSAWELPEGASITTDRLTGALQMHPPAFVFSSSCESAETTAPGEAVFEFQTFDLPSAFLEAGVEAYVGTLWPVEASAAYELVMAFYDAILGGQSLGESLRQAKWACKHYEKQNRPGDCVPVDWLAFVLYGDPHLEPGDLFPAMRRRRGQT